MNLWFNWGSGIPFLFVPVQYSTSGLYISRPTQVKTLLAEESRSCHPLAQLSVNVLFSVIGPLDGVILAILPLVCCPVLGRVHVGTEMKMHDIDFVG